MGVCLIQIHSTPGTAPHHVKHSDNVVSRVHDLHNLGAVRFPRGNKPVNPLLELGVAMKGARLWDLGPKYHLAIGSYRERNASTSPRFQASTARRTSLTFSRDIACEIISRKVSLAALGPGHVARGWHGHRY